MRKQLIVIRTAHTGDIPYYQVCELAAPTTRKASKRPSSASRAHQALGEAPGHRAWMRLSRAAASDALLGTSGALDAGEPLAPRLERAGRRHLTPRSAGGADSPSNLVLACRACIDLRQTKSLSAWARLSPELGFTSRSIRAQARRCLPVAA